MLNLSPTISPSASFLLASNMSMKSLLGKMRLLEHTDGGLQMKDREQVTGEIPLFLPCACTSLANQPLFLPPPPPGFPNKQWLANAYYFQSLSNKGIMQLIN